MFNKLFMTTALALPLAFSGAASAQTPAKKPNIVVIMADDVGIWNISAYHRGMMGGSTPNIDRIAREARCSPTITRSSPAPQDAPPSSSGKPRSAPAC